ncbi:hypothetical protein B0I35DRAFT_407257 [Stachybotrys elegans]|uniref:ARID domain-containing protein n=1 Tax=Stachybotrys elegans TaxID=80388 RepID=A0A8K0T164_9HYPO|nr:hypothetical protein B0I35DRAFT_407257 [Stachybotrys elegans]
MSAWMSDAVPNHNANGFPHMNDPNATSAMMDPSAFMASPAQFNPAQFANQQQMAGMQNSPMRNASPSYQQNPVYQTNSVIPSKRPRPREDSLAGSPRPNPGMLPTSRSETPQQQNFPGYQPGAMGQQTPGQFPHLQTNGSANASPSPIMGSQMRPGSVPQRVATASPHPFSPSAQQFGAQASPIPSEHGTPQPNHYMQNMTPSYNPNFAQSPSNPHAAPPNAMAAGQMMPQHMGQMPNAMYGQMPQANQQQPQMQQQQHQIPSQQQQQNPQQQQGPHGQQRSQSMSEQQKMAAYQMRLQQQLQGNMQMQQAQGQMHPQAMGRGMMPKQPMPGMHNGQMPQGPPRPQQQRPTPAINPEQFMKNLMTLMNAKGLPLDPNPIVADRPVNLLMLFQAVQSKGGYKQISMNNAWAHIAQALGLPAQIPTVPPTLKQVYERNLSEFEKVWKQRMMQQQQQQGAAMPGPGTPNKQVPQPNPQMNQGQMQPQHPVVPPQHAVKPGQPPVNGLATPQHQPHSQQPSNVPGHTKNALSRTSEPVQPNDLSMPSPAMPKPGMMPDARTGAVTEHRLPPLAKKSDEYSPCSRELATHGGIDVSTVFKLGHDLEKWIPDVPSINELGVVDIQALTRSLQSGIHGEVRLALDVLATVSVSPSPAHQLQLRYCDDLVDALIDCAEEQLDLLAEHTVEVSDEIQLSPYEDVVRSCRLEQYTVRDIPTFGSTAYDLDRAVDRLICITTILRNVSFPGEQNENHLVLADESVIKFLCVVIRYLGTRTMLLRTHQNTLDFMKDLVILLSNISGSIEIPSREQAFCLLQFLLAFAPTPAPSASEQSGLLFAPYDSSAHPYLPHAIDSLAKLLARDEPNRTHYKTIFAIDGADNGTYDLLTRAFALAISPVPDRSKDRLRPPNFPSLVEVRKPFLMQGLLAGEILVSIAPGSDSTVARSWLLSASGFGKNLAKLVSELTHVFEQPHAYARGPARAQPRKDPELVYIVVVGVALLRRLAEKARDPGSPSSDVLADILPSSQTLMEALSLQSPEWTKEGLLQQLTAFFNLGM